MSNPISNSKTFSVLNMATALRQKLQSLKEQADDVVQQDQPGARCMVQKLIGLINATSLGHELAQELSHRLYVDGDAQKICPDHCEILCPWFRAAQRVDRWQRELELDRDVYRLALYDFQRGIGMSVSLIEYLEKNLQGNPDSSQWLHLEQSAGCLSSWIRKLVQLLYLISEYADCCDDQREHSGA